jgi:hypothetical protein
MARVFKTGAFMDYGKFNGLPVWDRKIADFLQFLQPVAGALLLATGFLCLFAAVKYADKPALQILILAFLWSP